MKFELDQAQVDRFKAWRAEVQKRGAQKQLDEAPSERRDELRRLQGSAGVPYVGAAGGQFTFSFTHTSLGDVAKVKDAVTGEELDLSDYDSW